MVFFSSVSKSFAVSVFGVRSTIFRRCWRLLDASARVLEASWSQLGTFETVRDVFRLQMKNNCSTHQCVRVREIVKRFTIGSSSLQACVCFLHLI